MYMKQRMRVSFPSPPVFMIHHTSVFNSWMYKLKSLKHTHTHTHTCAHMRRKREKERETLTLTHGLLWGHRPIHKEGIGGGGGGERIYNIYILVFITLQHYLRWFDGQYVHCSAYICYFTWYSHDHKIHHKIHHIRTGCWITSIIPISHCLTVANKYSVTKPAFLLCASKRKKQTLQLSC